MLVHLNTIKTVILQSLMVPDGVVEVVVNHSLLFIGRNLTAPLERNPPLLSTTKL